MGSWAEERVPHMTADEKNAAETFLALETPDLWKWLSGQEPAPPEVTAFAAYQELKARVDTHVDKYMDPASSARKGVEWVRGWNDGANGKGRGNGMGKGA